MEDSAVRDLYIQQRDTQYQLVWNLLCTLSCGWWPVITLIVLLWRGHLLSIAGFLTFIPCEFLAILVPIPVTFLIGLVIGATIRSARYANSGYVLGLVAAPFVMAADVYVVILVSGWLIDWLG